MSQLVIQGVTYSLVGVGAGAAVHLAPGERGAEGQFRTLCGREAWKNSDDAVSPSCRRCLASVDAQLPVRAPNSAIGVIVDLVLQALRDHGTAEVLGVPGDQLALLRRAIRRAVHDELGFSVKTFVNGGLLHVSSKEAFAPHEERHLKEAMEQIGGMFSGREVDPIDNSAWRFRWSTWAVD